MHDHNRQSFNDGFWDGYHDQRDGRKPVWTGTHPNQYYNAGYKHGVKAYKTDGEWSVHSSQEAWEQYQKELASDTVQ